MISKHRFAIFILFHLNKHRPMHRTPDGELPVNGRNYIYFLISLIPEADSPLSRTKYSSGISRLISIL
jgi:hypothetical protein